MDWIWGLGAGEGGKGAAVRKESAMTLWLKTTFRKLRSWHLVPSLHGKSMGKQWKLTDYFWGLQNHCRW